MKKDYDILVIGGGAAGFFGAINAAENSDGIKIAILEKSSSVLQKVKVSGGGRCNVCNAETDPKQLTKAYPRGSKELLGPFFRFSTSQVIGWFEDHNVRLKAEPDGRMFPMTNKSQTILDCFEMNVRALGIQVITGFNVSNMQKVDDRWEIMSTGGEQLTAKKVLLAPGSSNVFWKMMEGLGHTIIKPVPSLFTFNIESELIKDLPGVAVPEARVSIEGTKLKEKGPVLITHWGLSGPAVLRLSAWGAVVLHEMNYEFTVRINWAGDINQEEARQMLSGWRDRNGKTALKTGNPFGLPKRLWSRMLVHASADEEGRWAELGGKKMNLLIEIITNSRLDVRGKSTFKDEFVTCGGIDLKEVDFNTMESRVLPGLYFAGEVLNIDAITGGYNFQAAWTTSWIAAQSMTR